MMALSRMKKITLDGYTIAGYSVAGEETVISMPDLNVCFDVGRCPEEALLMDNLFISHGHMDHCAGIAYYCSQRGFREMAPGTVVVPLCLKDKIEALLDLWGEIDGNRPPANIIGVVPGDEVQIRRGLFARVFQTNHSRGAVGYTIIDRRHKLKNEYCNLSGPEIARLRKSGEEVTYVLDFPIVTFLGDTMPGDFLNLDYVRNSKILLTECTFIDPEHTDRALAGRHLHVVQLAEILRDFNNEYIVLTHLSRRTYIRDAKRRVRQLFSQEMYKKVSFLMEQQRKSETKT